MSEELNNINDQLAKINRKAYSDIEFYYSELITLLNQLDPIKLLSQLFLTFLTIPEGQFNDETSDVHKWARWIELIAGYLLIHNYPQQGKKEIDGKDIENIEALVKKYFDCISLYLITDRTNTANEQEVNSVIHTAKNDSLYVRGESYPHQLKNIANVIYTQHDKWFTKNLGFTIGDAFSLSEAIIKEYNRRINNEKQSCKDRARTYVEGLIQKGEIKEEERKDLETNIFCYYYFVNSDVISLFTLEELIQFSGFPKKICESYLKRLSQEFGYRNRSFPDTFKDPHSAPWDYNTLYERPIVTYDNKYFVPIPSLLCEILLHTFYYDLIADNHYWISEGEKKYGKSLEVITSKYLNNIFPAEEVILNPNYPNGNELCDVLILHDRNVIIVQCKTKRLRYESKIGKDIQLIKDDIEKSVKESFDQGIRARDYFSNNQPAKITIDSQPIEIDSKQISNIILISVTLGSYPHLMTRLANINPALRLFSDNQYPWAISIFDLGIITELIESPSVFIHYSKRRLAIERTYFNILADELDLLGFYFTQGLYFETEEFEKLNALALSGFSSDIDKYVFEKYELGGNPQKPEQKTPYNFSEYIKTIEALNSSYKTDCATRLLDLDYKGKELFVNMSDKIKQQTVKDGNLHSFSTVLKNNTTGFSFISMNTNGNLEELFRQVFCFSTVKKYVTKCKEWVGFGWDRNSNKIIDIAEFQSYDWQEDSVIEQMAKETLKPGMMINTESQ
jgi:hypothetical protein